MDNSTLTAVVTVVLSVLTGIGAMGKWLANYIERREAQIIADNKAQREEHRTDMAAQRLDFTSALGVLSKEHREGMDGMTKEITGAIQSLREELVNR